MSSSIWTACGGGSELRRLAIDAWRVVEAQHQIATRRLVATDAEQQLLEELIERVKPPEPTRGRLHYLLFTPFRYAPLRHGSRFGCRTERGIWYGSERLETALAEIAYYRLLFLEGTTAELGAVATALTAFRIVVHTEAGIDLTTPPFAAHDADLADPASYHVSQPLGSAMRESGVHAFRYRSARDTRRSANIGAFDPVVFGRRQPRDLQTWHCTATRARIDLMRRDYFRHSSFAFERIQFLVHGTLPSPQL